MLVNPYLTFNGNAEEAMNFYKNIFKVEFEMFSRFSDYDDPNNPIPEDKKNWIMHISMPISNEIRLMASDIHPIHSQEVVLGSNITLSVNANSKEEAHTVFHALAENGIITMPIADSFWGAYFGMLTDKFGIHWMVNYDYPKS